MMKKWTLYLCIALLAASCTSIFSSKPAGTLSEDEMIDILVDMHLTAATLRISNDSLIRLNDTTDQRIRFAHIFRKYDISPADFNASLNYYLEHIETLDKIYVEVINRLTELEAALQSIPLAAAANKPFNNEIAPDEAQLSNPWFNTLYKPTKPASIHYFSQKIYPFDFE